MLDFYLPELVLLIFSISYVTDRVTAVVRVTLASSSVVEAYQAFATAVGVINEF